MPVVIDQFEIIRDQQQPGETPGPSAGRSAAASSPSPPPLSPVDIDVTVKHLTERALRLRAT